MVFAAEDDYEYYLHNLWEWKEKLDCRIYAFCLTTNHLHLIEDPGVIVKILAHLGLPTKAPLREPVQVFPLLQSP